MKLLIDFLSKCKVNLNSDSEFFLVPRIFATKKGHVASKSQGISYSRTREIFIEKLKAFGMNHKSYGLHSLRSGGASAASDNLPENESTVVEFRNTDVGKVTSAKIDTLKIL